MRKKKSSRAHKAPRRDKPVKATSHDAFKATSLDNPGMLPVVMALASSVRGVKVSTLKSGRPIKLGAGLMDADVAFETTPSNLHKLMLNDPRVGIKSGAEIEVLRSNLAHL